MKKMIFRLFALMLALIMALALICGCNKTGDNVDDGDNIENPGDIENPDKGDSDKGDSDDSDDSEADESVRITTTIYEIAKHGNLILYMYGSELFDNGFEHGDIVEIAIGDKKWDVPLCTNYSDVDSGEAVLRATSPTDGVVLALNLGDFASTAGIANKTVIDEEPGYRWDYVVETPVQIIITLKEEDGYREEWLIRQLVRSNERDDYPHLTDEEFANFRAIGTTGMGKSLLYRSSSPIKPELGRSTYADNAAKNAGILTIVNLADASNTYEGTEDSYYNTCNVAYVNLGMDFLSESALIGIAEGMRFIIENDGPYLIHCNEGKDRAGFVSAMLECLMGATIDEVIEDYMVTYYNYYGVGKGTEKYDVIVKKNLIKELNTTFGVEDIYKADLVAEAEEYLIEDAGLTAEEVAALKAKLRISIQEVYDAGKDLTSLLGDSESVVLKATSNGVDVWEKYFSEQYSYSFYDDTYMNVGFDYSSFISNNSEYYWYENTYVRNISLDTTGVADLKEALVSAGKSSFISSVVLNDEATVVENDGLIIVSCTADLDEIFASEDVVSCVEIYTLDAVTREMLSVKTVYTFEDGTVEEGIVTITRNADILEGMKPYLEYDQETEDVRTVTVVTNPGTENEKIDNVKVPKGMPISTSCDWETLEYYTIYTDAECTVPFEKEADLNADLTVYVKWEGNVNEALYEDAFELIEEGDYEEAYELFLLLGDYKDAAKQASYFRYMPTNHVIEFAGEDGEDKVTYTVTLNDKNLIETVVEEYESGFKHTCTYTHNEFGYVTRRECTDTAGNTTVYEATYDENGNRLSHVYTDAEGNVNRFDFTLNDKGQIVSEVTTNAPDFYRSYTIEYDDEGREIKIVYVYDDGIYTEENTYNEAGDIVKNTWAKDGVIYYEEDYKYDEEGKLVEILYTEDGEADGLVKLTYNDKGQIVKEEVTYVSGEGHTYDYSEYDENGNAGKIIFDKANGKVGDYVMFSTFKLVYLPYDYPEVEWDQILYSTQCLDWSHFY